jgi:hypothetical protein
MSNVVPIRKPPADMEFRRLTWPELKLMSTDEVDKYIDAKNAYEAASGKRAQPVALHNGPNSHTAEVEAFWDGQPVAESGNCEASEPPKRPPEEETLRASGPTPQRRG